jgi:predicted amidophosphoribosyltransferase
MSARWGDRGPGAAVLALALIAMGLFAPPAAASRGGDAPHLAAHRPEQAVPNAMNVVLIDDFTDGDYTANPAWTVPRPTWGVVGGELWATDNGAQIIQTARTETVATWTFKFRLETADGTTDRFTFWPMSSGFDINGVTNGYAYWVDAAGGAMRLVRRSGATTTDFNLISTTWTPDTVAHTGKITRNAAGLFEIFLDGASKGTATDTTHTTSSYVGLHFVGSSADTNHNAMIDDLVVTTVNPPQATVTAPNGGESWVGGSSHAISWTSAQGDFPLKSNSAALYYSTTGCSGAWTQIVTGQPTSGSYAWTVPSTPSTQACVRVTVEDDQTPANVGADASNAVFTISPGNSPPSVALVAPAAGGAIGGVTKIEWDGADADSNTVSYVIKLSQDSGANWNQIATASHAESPTPTRRSVPFDTTTFSDKATYRLRIEANDGNGSATNASSAGDWAIDNTKPACTMTALPPFVTAAQIALAWNGTDATAGIAGYDMMVSENGAPKYGWLWNATNTSASFPGVDGITYGFFCEPWDKAGNHQTKANPDASTTVDLVAPSSRVSPMPRAVPSTTFDVGFTVVDATATSTTIHWRLTPAGPWTPAGPFPLPKGVTQGKGSVTVQSEGKYEFYSVATDAAGRNESKGAVAETETIVDTLPPSISASVLDSLVAGTKVKVDIDAQDNLELDNVLVEFMPADGSAQWKVVRNFSSILKPAFQMTTDVTLTGAMDGAQLVRFVAVDSAGQRALSSESKVTVDSKRPTVVSTVPPTGAADIAPEGPFKLVFSEPMNKTSVENALKIAGGPSPPRVGAVTWSGEEAAVDLAGLVGNASYTLTVSTDAMDVAGNKLEKAVEVKFSTVPTHGKLTGTVREPSGAAVKGAVLRLTQGNESVIANVSKEGTFSVESMRAGTWTVRGEARGYLPMETTVAVAAAKTTNAELTMEKDVLPTLVGSGIGGVVLLIVLFLLLRLFAKKCHVCKNRLPRSANACPVCGNVAKHKSKLDLQRQARLAREKGAADQQKATIDQIKREHASRVAAQRAAGPGLAVQRAPARPRPTTCRKCSAPLKPEDEWCPKCGQAVFAAGATEECGECGGTVVDGECISCGWTKPAAQAPSQAAQPPVKDVPSGSEAPPKALGGPGATEPVQERSAVAEPAARKEDRPSAEPAMKVAERAENAKPGGATLCPTCGSANHPTTKWCEGCGEKLS